MIVEGGKYTIDKFISSNNWDEARVFIGDIYINEGTKAPEINKNYYSKEYIKKDTLLIYRKDD